jgi:hypothetical protein
MGFYILVDGLSHYFYMGSLACPARFERATYALEEFVAAGKSLYFNGLHAQIGTVQ